MRCRQLGFWHSARHLSSTIPLSGEDETKPVVRTQPEADRGFSELLDRKVEITRDLLNRQL